MAFTCSNSLPLNQVQGIGLCPLQHAHLNHARRRKPACYACVSSTATTSSAVPATGDGSSASSNVEDNWKEAITPGITIEYWAKGEPCIGTVQSINPNSLSLLDALPPASTPRTVSHDQVMGVWPEAWDAGGAAANAATLLENTDVRRAVLSLFAAHSRGARAPFSSSEAADALFPLAADRAAAAVAAGRVLAAHPARFRRAGAGRGWRAHAPSAAATREEGAFVAAARALLAAPPPHPTHAWPAEQRALLGAVEVAASAGGAPPPRVARVLAALGFPPTAAGAARLLLALGHWARRSASPGVARKTSLREAHRRSGAPAPVARGGTFPPEVLDTARALRDAARGRRAALNAAQMESPRRDAARLGGPAFCVDEAGSRFLDDAVSVRALHGGAVVRVLVHVADVAVLVDPGGALDALAAERGQTLYLPLRPLHMLPPAAMEAASFSATLPAHAVTVELDLDVKRGALLRWDVFPSLVPRVVRVSYDAYDALLAAPDEPLPGVLSAPRARALRLLAEVAPKLAAATDRRRVRAQPRSGPNSVSGVRLVRNRGGGGGGRVAEVAHFRDGGAHAVIGDLLIAAGAVLREFARERGVALPEGVGADGYALRCGTAPLRRYFDLVVQRQIRAALFGEQPAGWGEMDMLRDRLARGAAAANKTVSQARTAALLDALADRCARQTAASKRSRAVLRGSVRNASVSRSGVVRATVSLEGGGVIADAGLSQSLADKARAMADTGVSRVEGKTARHEARLRAMGQLLQPGSNVRVEIDEINSVAQMVKATICEITETM